MIATLTNMGRMKITCESNEQRVTRCSTTQGHIYAGEASGLFPDKPLVRLSSLGESMYWESPFLKKGCQPGTLQ